MRIGIYGGSFNPIHNGHIFLAKKIMMLASLDEIWFVVSPQNPLKSESDLLCDDKRLEMVSMALKDEKSLVPSDYEFHLPRPSYTWDTLQSLSKKYPGRSFSLIIGADNWQDFDKWYHHKEIISNYEIVIYPRKGVVIDHRNVPNNVILADTDMIDISSTDIRMKIRRGEYIKDLVPEAVCDIIQREGLYL